MANIQGFEQFNALLRRFPEITARMLSDTMRDILVMLSGRMARYPKPPPDSTYIRTGTLGRLWTSEPPTITGNERSIIGYIGNKTPYGPYVQDEVDQANVHRGRWQTNEQVVKASMPEIEQLLEMGLEQVLREVTK